MTDSARIRIVGDSTGMDPDTGRVIPDSAVFHTLPPVPGGVPAGFGTGVWVWDRTALLDSRAWTLLELVERIPGVISLRGGDYGAPESVAVFGGGAGRVRVFLDGFEQVPLDGSVPDLAGVPLGGLEEVRVERGLLGLRIDLRTLVANDPRPLSIVEAGTGDLDTNFFRGTFIHPRSLFSGSLALALERVDTDGRDEDGARPASWVRYTLHRGDEAGLRIEMRRARHEVDAEGLPVGLSRTDWIVRARARLVPGLVAEVFSGHSSVDGPEEDVAVPVEESRYQHGARVGFEAGTVWARGAVRLLSGPSFPRGDLEVEAGGSLWEGRAGVAGSWHGARWDAGSPWEAGVRGWVAPIPWLSLFAAGARGERGALIFPEPPPFPDPVEAPFRPGVPVDPGPTFRIVERTAVRVGATARWGRLRASGALLRVEADSLHPTGLSMDRDGASVEGATFQGFEVDARLGVPGAPGLDVLGRYQHWDQGAVYLPARSYFAGLDYHRTFLESGNLELWGFLGVRGRDPMVVPVGAVDPDDPDAEPVGPSVVPFYQNWQADVQVRIVTVHVQIRFENFTVRRNLQDLPGRLLPITRATYGVKWRLWN